MEEHDIVMTSTLEPSESLDFSFAIREGTVDDAARGLRYVRDHSGVWADDIATAFGWGIVKASEIVWSLMDAGILVEDTDA